jgi:hypothetical protein
MSCDLKHETRRQQEIRQLGTMRLDAGSNRSTLRRKKGLPHGEAFQCIAAKDYLAAGVFAAGALVAAGVAEAAGAGTPDLVL